MTFIAFTSTILSEFLQPACFAPEFVALVTSKMLSIWIKKSLALAFHLNHARLGRLFSLDNCMIILALVGGHYIFVWLFQCFELQIFLSAGDTHIVLTRDARQMEYSFFI
jgi:hypothetical protein